MVDRDHTGRTLLLVGGAAFAAWWLLARGGGGGTGKPGTGREGTGTGNGGDITVVLPERCMVWIRGDRIEIDGVVADLATVVARCRLVGKAEVRATGDAPHGVVHRVAWALYHAGVKVYAPPSVASIAPGAEELR